MKQMMISVALFGAILTPIAACAETPMEMLIVTPARMPQQLDKAIADTTVLDEQEIRNSGARDVPALLRSLAGVEVAQSGGLGNVSSTFMRGTNSDQVLVLLDGVRINSATSGTTALEHIMLDSVERIEVVRGNVSSLYGSEAIGGVIQLFIKRGQDSPAFNASAGIGSHDTQRLAAGYSGETNGNSFSVNAGRVTTDGVSAMNPLLAPGANPNNNGYENNTLDAQFKHAFNTDHSVSALLFATRGDISYDNPYGLPTDLNNTVETIDKLSLASDDQINRRWHSLLRVAQGTDDSRSYGYTYGVPTSSRFQTQSNQLTWQNTLKIADNQHIDLAAEYLDQEVSSNTLYTQTSRNVKSLVGGYVGEYGVHQAQINLRQDNFSDFGMANTGLLGYGVQFTGAFRFTVTVSNAFKAPTFNDMYYPLSYGYQGNPNLKPERSQNREAGLHYTANGQRADAVYFDNHIRDLIACNAGCTTVVNIDQAQIDGAEFSYEGEFGKSRLQASATFQNPRDAITGQVLLRRAKEFSSVAATHEWAAWQIGADVRYSGARQDYDLNGNPVTLDGYILLNLSARHMLDRGLYVSAHLDNVFDREYSEVYAYNTLGRTLFVELNYQQ